MTKYIYKDRNCIMEDIQYFKLGKSSTSYWINNSNRKSFKRKSKICVVKPRVRNCDINNTTHSDTEVLIVKHKSQNLKTDNSDHYSPLEILSTDCYNYENLILNTNSIDTDLSLLDSYDNKIKYSSLSYLKHFQDTFKNLNCLSSCSETYKYSKLNQKSCVIRNKMATTFKARSNSTTNVLDNGLNQYYSCTDLGSLSRPSASLLQMSFGGSGNNAAKMYQTYKGQLCLNISSISSSKEKTIKLNITEAKDLDADPFSSYYSDKNGGVFVCVTMQGKSSAKQKKTFVVKGTNNPVFDYELKFDIKKKDYKKRVLISVHQIQELSSGFRAASTVNKMLGCMSFGVENLIMNQTNVNGYYYLLADQIGSTKHMKVEEESQNVILDKSDSVSIKPAPARRSSVISTTSSSSSSSRNSDSGYNDSGNDSIPNSPASSDDEDDKSKICITSTNKILTKSMDNIKVELNKKLNQGYGIKLTDSVPAVMVSDIKAGSPADYSGLQLGDYVMGVDGVAVHDLSAQTLGRVIRHCGTCVVLQVVRWQQADSCSSDGEEVVFKESRLL